MAKVGGPSLPPVVPQQRPAEPAAPQAPASPAASPANLQNVANPFGSAFVSAGKLAGQLVKNLTGPAVPQKKPGAQEAQSTSEKGTQGLEQGGREGQQVSDGKQQIGQRREEAGQSSQQGRQGGQGQTEAPQGSVGAAFAALRNSRLFKAKTQKKKGARADRSKRKDDYEEEERDRHVVRNWIKGELEETDYDQGRREALRLQQLDKQGEAPSRLARELNAQLRGDRQDDFRSTLSETLQPQLDALAERVESLPDDERRAMSAMFARASHQVTQKSATAYQKLLRATATAEAQTLEGAGAVDLVARADALGQALRRAASAEYRQSLIEAAAPELAALARSLEGLSPPERAGVLQALFKASVVLAPSGSARMAAALAEGLNQPSDANPEQAWSPVLRLLGPALSSVPGAGDLAFQLRAAAPAGLVAGDGLPRVLQEARERLKSLNSPLRQSTAPAPASGAGAEDQAHSLAFEEACAVAAQLLPACVRGLDLFDRLGREEGQPLRDQALLLLATLDVVAPTRAGQRVLRQAQVSQERGEESFLEGLPKVARTLGQARLSGLLSSHGFSPRTFEQRGAGFLQRLASHASTALAGPVFARLRKRDQGGALRLLRSGLRSNAGLYSLSPEGARQVCELLEGLLLRPQGVSEEQVNGQLARLLTSHATDRAGAVETLQPLVKVLLQDRTPPQRHRPMGASEASERNERSTALSATDLALEQERLARRQAETRPQPPQAAPSRTSALRAGDLAAAQHSLIRSREEAARPRPLESAGKQARGGSQPAGPPGRPTGSAPAQAPAGAHTSAGARAPAPAQAPATPPAPSGASTASGEKDVSQDPLRIPKLAPRG